MQNDYSLLNEELPLGVKAYRFEIRGIKFLVTASEGRDDGVNVFMDLGDGKTRFEAPSVWIDINKWNQTTREGLVVHVYDGSSRDEPSASLDI